MIQIPGHIPIFIHPLFWLLAGFIGWINAPSISGIIIWMGIIFVSVLIHEYGHALTSVFFKQKAKIQLVALGGITSYEGPKLKFWQQFIIVFNGPLFGFFLFLGAAFLLKFSWSPIVTTILEITKLANLFWTVVNLLPVQPLDGGQLLRIVLEGTFGIRGFKASLLIGAIVAVLFSFAFFMIQAFLAGALFFLFAFQSFDLWRKSQIATGSDRDEETRNLLIKGERALQEGKKQEAKALFSQVCEKTKTGVLGSTAAQYLAILLNAEGKSDAAYDLLTPWQDHLGDDTKCLLHKLGAEHQDHVLVAKLSKECYQVAPTKEMALKNARAFAHLKEARKAGGWLQAAWSYGGLSLETVLLEPCFSALQGIPAFDGFVRKMTKSNDQNRN